MALLLDLANILGGLLLSVPLLARLPRIGDALSRFAERILPWAWLVGLVALIAGGFFLIVHVFSGHIWHFEVVGIAVGVLLLWDRLTGRRPLPSPALAGPGLIISVFGVIAIVVGLQGLVTPD